MISVDFMYSKKLFVFKMKNNGHKPWLVWLSGLSMGLRTKRSPVQFPVRAHAWIAGQVPSRNAGEATTIDVSLPLSLLPPLSKNK